MNREQRRATAKNKDMTQIEEQVALFSKLPDECLTCEKTYDKNDKEMAMSWSVVIHGEEEIVRLYCPDCWQKAKKITEDFAKHLEEKYGETPE
tara:strand:+ start:407 stop:685 length:279 start_codon:yes stop_codon:yes gene_type:complete